MVRGTFDTAEAIFEAFLRGRRQRRLVLELLGLVWRLVIHHLVVDRRGFRRWIQRGRAAAVGSA